jgi:hypothetical protein
VALPRPGSELCRRVQATTLMGPGHAAITRSRTAWHAVELALGAADASSEVTASWTMVEPATAGRPAEVGRRASNIATVAEPPLRSRQWTRPEA